KIHAGMYRTIKLRVYPSPEQTEKINQTIRIVRFVWNTIWLSMLHNAEHSRREYALCRNGSDRAWREAWRYYPDPTEMAYNRARISAMEHSERGWIAGAIQTPLARAARIFALTVRSSYGRNGSTDRVRPRCRRDDEYSSLEWQLQGNAPFGGKKLESVVDK